MSSVIEFLERMGADARLRHASHEAIAAALEESQVDSALGAAIIARSTADLYSLLDQRPMFCTLENPGREKEKEGEDKDKDKEGDGEGQSDKKKKSSLTSPIVSRSALNSLA